MLDEINNYHYAVRRILQPSLWFPKGFSYSFNTFEQCLGRLVRIGQSSASTHLPHTLMNKTELQKDMDRPSKRNLDYLKLHLAFLIIFGPKSYEQLSFYTTALLLPQISGRRRARACF